MKLPLKSGRYGALKQLLVFVGIVADEREQWSQLAGVPAPSHALCVLTQWRGT